MEIHIIDIYLSLHISLFFLVHIFYTQTENLVELNSKKSSFPFTIKFYQLGNTEANTLNVNSRCKRERKSTIFCDMHFLEGKGFC